MKKQNVRKLVLAKETVRALDERRIQVAVRGGVSHETYCFTDNCSWHTCGSIYC
jgi:hypothetical protein